jgi:hypothetical protein
MVNYRTDIELTLDLLVNITHDMRYRTFNTVLGTDRLSQRCGAFLSRKKIASP